MDLDLWGFLPWVPCSFCVPFFFTFKPVPITSFSDVLFMNTILTLCLNYIGMFFNSRHMRLCKIFNKTWQNVRGGIKEENWVYRIYKESIQVSTLNAVFIHLVFTEDLLPAKTPSQSWTVYIFWSHWLKTFQNRYDPHHPRQGKGMLFLTKRHMMYLLHWGLGLLSLPFYKRNGEFVR